MTFDNEDRAAREALFDRLLEPDEMHLKRMRTDALRAGQGIDTGFHLHQRNAKGDVSDFVLRIPKFAITMICARTGAGKTSVMCNLALRMTLGGANGLFITLEEPGFSIRAKLLAAYSKTVNRQQTMSASTVWEATKALAGKGEVEAEAEFNASIMWRLRVVDANAAFNEAHISTPSIMYDPQDIMDLISHRNAKSSAPLDFVIIDFGQLMKSDEAENSNSYQRMKAVMQGLKNMSGGLGIAVIVGAQLQRSCSSVEVWDWEPEMIRDGSDMEQAASLIIAIGQDKTFHNSEYELVLRFLKNRNGPKRVAGMFAMDFERCHMDLNGLEPVSD